MVRWKSAALAHFKRDIDALAATNNGDRQRCAGGMGGNIAHRSASVQHGLAVNREQDVASPLLRLLGLHSLHPQQ